MKDLPFWIRLSYGSALAQKFFPGGKLNLDKIEEGLGRKKSRGGGGGEGSNERIGRHH